MKKQVLMAVTALTFSLGISGTALAAGWQQNKTGWWYEKEDKTYPANVWFQDPANGKWYHFDANGYMQTGWIEDGGKHYYLDMESGAMWANAVTPDGWQLDPSGAWMEHVEKKDPSVKNPDSSETKKEQAGWHEDQTGRWYQNPDGSYVKNRWKTINSSRYYFDEDGYATVGFAEIDGDEYYFSEKGVLKTKNFTLDGEVYIVNSKGVILDVVDEWDYENEEYDVPADYDNDRYDNSQSSSQGSGQSQKNESYGSGSSSNQVSDGLNREMAEQVIEIVNKEREKAGCSPLSMDDSLMEACEIRAEEIAEKFSHTRPDGTSCFSVLEGHYAYTTTGENIAEGQRTPESVMNSWMHSSGHKANILNASFEDIGVGCYIKNGTRHWVQLFGAE